MTTTAWHHLNLLLVWTLLCVTARQAMGVKNVFPKVMEDSQRYLSTYLNNDGNIPMKGGRLFPDGQLSKSDVQESGDVIVASETLKIYVNILTTMHSNTQDKTVRANLENLKFKIEELRKNYFTDHQKLLDHLKYLQNIDVTDKLVQRKAIYELKSVYNHASAIGEESKKPCPPACSLRRRRQTRQLRRKLKP